ncbi:MAG: DUF2905 domain-containing protein [Candidatus Pacearchaeota archaeon]
MANFLIIIGLILVIIGLLLKFNLILPGNILIKKEKFVFYFPIMTSIVLSIFLTILFWLINKFK